MAESAISAKPMRVPVFKAFAIFVVFVAVTELSTSSSSLKSFLPDETRQLQLRGIDGGTFNSWFGPATAMLDNEDTPTESEEVKTYSPHSLKSLREIYTDFVEKQVHFNNWKLGCNDLQFMAPYLRAISDRFSDEWVAGRNRVRRTIVDVGANAGDDAGSILGGFQVVRGMCKNFGQPIFLLSIEPSPKVFCEMTELMQDKHVNNPNLEVVSMLNIALSNETGDLIFRDPGNEGGSIIGGAPSPKAKMTKEEFTIASTCHLDSKQYKNMTVDWKRRTTVPTYTLDLLIESLESLGKYNKAVDRIFTLKVDTEGFDDKVLHGAQKLLQEQQIDFIIFETSRNFLLKSSVEMLSSYGYECFLLAPTMLVPVHATHWWYSHLDNFTGNWWGNAVCGIGRSPQLGMLWRMYHADNIRLANSYDVLYADRVDSVPK